MFGMVIGVDRRFDDLRTPMQVLLPLMPRLTFTIGSGPMGRLVLTAHRE
ncbi:MAG: hypothetical protein R3A46_19170 [Thermomicrobiales bacterium]